jgi:hypothetical protein
MLAFKSEGLNPKHEKINAKVRRFQSETSESSNKCFHIAPWGLPRGSIYRAVRGLVYIVQIAPDRPAYALSTRSRGHYSYSQFTIISGFQPSALRHLQFCHRCGVAFDLLCQLCLPRRRQPVPAFVPDRGSAVLQKHVIENEGEVIRSFL